MRKIWFIGLTAVLALFFGVGQATAATLCVNPTGAMGCFTTVQAAVDAAAPGDQIWVAPGVYYENVLVQTPSITIQGGVYSSAAPIRRRVPTPPTWTPADPSLVIIDGRPDPNCADTGEAIWIDGADYVTIANLTVRHAYVDNIYSDGDYTTIDTVHSLSSETYDGVYIDADYATVRNCYITANPLGVEIYGDNAQVGNNSIYNNDNYGVYITGLAPVVVGNRIDGADYDGVYLGYADGGTVSQNTIRGASSYGVEVYDTDNCTVSSNDILSCTSGGIYMDLCDESAASGNYIGGINGDGIYVSYDTVGNNVISDNTVEDLYREGIDVLDLDTTVTGNTIRNTGRTGMAVSSDGGTISDNLVEGARDESEGYDLMVENTIVSKNVAQFNAGEGLRIEGDNNTISNNTARYNGSDWEGGFRIFGDNNTISGNLAEMNPGYGFTSYGDNTLAGNTATNNYRTGIYLVSTNGGTLQVNANVATNNHGEGIANFASTGTVNVINNTALGNRTDICNDIPGGAIITTFTGNTFATGGPTVDCCLQ
jgi:parallel beta-helix repeat protein